jgi:hypothetical protein
MNHILINADLIEFVKFSIHLALRIRIFEKIGLETIQSLFRKLYDAI